MKKLKVIPIAVITFCASAVAQAQPATPTVFSLKESIAYSLTNNPTSTIYKNEVLIAKQKKTEALAGYLPQVNGTGTFDDNLKRQVTVLPAGAFSKEEVKLQFGNQYNTSLVAQVDQTIFDRTITVAKEANRVNTLLADLKLLQNNETIIYNTIAAYYQILTINEQEKLLVENEKKYEEMLRILQLQYEKGVAKKIDYDRIRVSQSNIKSQLSLLKTNKELALNKLKFAMGMDLAQTIAINDSLNYSMQVSMPIDTKLETKNLLDYKILSNNIKLQQLDVERKKFAFYPTLSGYARYGAQTFGNDFSKSFGNWFDYSSMGLKLSIPIFDGNRKKSQLAQSRLSLLNAEENLKISSRNYELQFQNANTALFRSYTSMNDNKETLELASDILKNTSLQYQKGAASLTDFLNSDYSFKEAQSNYISSLLNFLTARVDFEKHRATFQHMSIN